MPALKRYFSGLSAGTFLLALGSLFADTSTEMLYPILPIFLTRELGASVGAVGLVEGIAQAVQNLTQGFSGPLSDRLRRRKAIAIAGYTVAALGKPLIGVAGSWLGVLGARALERFGTGIRSAPRDALIAASVADAHRGRAFGLEGAGDNLGACLGPLFTVVLVGTFGVALRSIFLLAVVPGALAALMVVLVRERPAAPAPHAPGAPVGRLPRDYYRVLVAVGLFGIGNSSNSFLILRTQQLGASVGATVFVYAAFNLVAALASYPTGALSDRLGRKWVLLSSLLVFAGVYLGFGVTSHVAGIGLLFALYGLHQGAFRSVGKALATDFVPEELRATAVGGYSATLGLTGLFASIVGGQLWVRFGPAATFLFGAASALAGAAALLLLVPGTSLRSGRAPRPGAP